jgi:hypothetical protein
LLLLLLLSELARSTQEEIQQVVCDIFVGIVLRTPNYFERTLGVLVILFAYLRAE